MMLELSPLETAANASARSMPASTSTSRSKPWPDDLAPGELGAEPAERLRVLVDHGHLVAEPIEARGERRADPAAAHDDDVHGGTLSQAATRGRPRTAYASAVPSIRVALKRILVGRPFRSDRLAHTLLSKRIALPVFASDAMSCVAYAPDEILLTLSIAGASAYALSPWIGLAVVVVLLTVVASYRQNVHAYPSGGGDYEVATTNLGPQRRPGGGQRAAGRLRADGRGVDLLRRRPTSARSCRSWPPTRCCSRSARSCCSPR